MLSEFVSIAVAITIAAVAAVTDATTGRIPNWLTLPVIGLLPLAHGAVDGLWALGASGFGALITGTVPFIMYRLTQGRAIGGGDIKLFAALGACLGATRGLEVQFGAYLAVAVVALLQLAWRGRLFTSLFNVGRILLNACLPRRHRRELEPELLTTFRMGPAICLATVISALPNFLFSTGLL